MYLEQWQKVFNTDINILLNKVLKDIENIIIDLNQVSQLNDKGIGSDGRSLGEYSPYTVEYKKAKGQIWSHVTLEDTGEFYRGFYVRWSSDSFQIWSSDGKTPKLVMEWGDEIFGLTDENLNELIWGSIYPELMKEINAI